MVGEDGLDQPDAEAAAAVGLEDVDIAEISERLQPVITRVKPTWAPSGA